MKWRHDDVMMVFWALIPASWQVDSLLPVSQNTEISNLKTMKWRHNDIIIVFL